MPERESPLMKDTALAFCLSRQAGERQGKPLHHTEIIGLALGKIVRHEQQFRIVALELVHGSTREFLRSQHADLLDDISARGSGYAWQRRQLLKSMPGLRDSGGGPRLRRQQSIEQTEPCHYARGISDIARPAGRHVQQLGVVGLEIEDDLGTAYLGTPIIEFTRDSLPGQSGHTRQRVHPYTFDDETFLGFARHAPGGAKSQLHEARSL